MNGDTQGKWRVGLMWKAHLQDKLAVLFLHFSHSTSNDPCFFQFIWCYCLSIYLDLLYHLWYFCSDKGDFGPL